jgi:hypothetical protein
VVAFRVDGKPRFGLDDVRPIFLTVNI